MVGGHNGQGGHLTGHRARGVADHGLEVRPLTARRGIGQHQGASRRPRNRVAVRQPLIAQGRAAQRDDREGCLAAALRRAVAHHGAHGLVRDHRQTGGQSLPDAGHFDPHPAQARPAEGFDEVQRVDPRHEAVRHRPSPDVERAAGVDRVARALAVDQDVADAPVDPQVSGSLHRGGIGLVHQESGAVVVIARGGIDNGPTLIADRADPHGSAVGGRKAAVGAGELQRIAVLIHLRHRPQIIDVRALPQRPVGIRVVAGHGDHAIRVQTGAGQPGGHRADGHHRHGAGGRPVGVRDHQGVIAAPGEGHLGHEQGRPRLARHGRAIQIPLIGQRRRAGNQRRHRQRLIVSHQGRHRRLLRERGRIQRPAGDKGHLVGLQAHIADPHLVDGPDDAFIVARIARRIPRAPADAQAGHGIAQRAAVQGPGRGERFQRVGRDAVGVQQRPVKSQLIRGVRIRRAVAREGHRHMIPSVRDRGVGPGGGQGRFEIVPGAPRKQIPFNHPVEHPPLPAAVAEPQSVVGAQDFIIPGCGGVGTELDQCLKSERPGHRVAKLGNVRKRAPIQQMLLGAGGQRSAQSRIRGCPHRDIGIRQRARGGLGQIGQRDGTAQGRIGKSQSVGLVQMPKVQGGGGVGVGDLQSGVGVEREAGQRPGEKEGTKRAVHKGLRLMAM